MATALIQGLEPGDHIIAAEDVYYGLRKITGEIFVKRPSKSATWTSRTWTLSAPRCARRPA